MKKHVKYYLVQDAGHAIYTKAESDLIFSDKEGEDFFKKKYPNATSIIKISKKKAEMFLGLSQLMPKEQEDERSVATKMP